MAALSLLQAIQAVGRPVFTTREIAMVRGSSVATTTQGLRRLAEKRIIERATRGVWYVLSDRQFSPYLLVPFLAGRHAAYVSFVSALHLHGLIEQIPQVIYVATTGPTRTKQTRAGTFSFHHIAPTFFGGFDWYRGEGRFLIASPGKALVDSLYLSTRKGRRFSFFPELELPRSFDLRVAKRWVAKIKDPLIRKPVERKLQMLVQKEGRREALRSTRS